MTDQRERKVTGWTYLGVFVVSLALLLPVMAGDMLVNRGVTLVSACALPVIAVLAASRVRLNDASAAYWAPALVWLIAVETVGQIGRDFTVETVRSQAVHLAYGLANNAVTVLGSTVAALTVVLIRRSRRP